MKDMLSQEQGRRLTLENTLKVHPLFASLIDVRSRIAIPRPTDRAQSKEDEIINARAEVARLLQELRRLKEVESDHVEARTAPQSRTLILLTSRSAESA